MHILSIQSNTPLWKNTIAYANACPWEAWPLLAQHMQDNIFIDWERVFVATTDDKIVGFCTFTKEDGIPDMEYTPYIGYIFVDEAYRGQRLSEQMIETVISYAKELHFREIYIVSSHIGLYEKYGFVKIDEKVDERGNEENIFVRSIVS